MSYVLLFLYVASLALLTVRLAQDRSHFDGCGLKGFATAAFLLLCPGINTLLALTALPSWRRS
jgi:hypothetical protein